MMSRLFNGALAVLFVVGAYALVIYLDRQPDRRDEKVQAINIEQRDIQTEKTARIERQWQMACDAKHGPNSAAEMGNDGLLRCSTRRGFVILKGQNK